MWYFKGFTLFAPAMDELTRAALWYGEDGSITDCTLGGINRTRLNQYPAFSLPHRISEVWLESDGISSTEPDEDEGKYSFQYMEHLKITDCQLVKDAFWHSAKQHCKRCIPWLVLRRNAMGCTGQVVIRKHTGQSKKKAKVV